MPICSPPARDGLRHLLPHRLWCPRPFGTYYRNKPCSAGTEGSGVAVSLCKADACGGPMSLEVGGGVEDDDDDDAASENPPPDPDPALVLQPPTSSTPMSPSMVLLDTWYVIKPGNTKEKIAFFVAHQFSGAGLPRPSAMKVKGNWATDGTKAKRRRCCSSYDPPTRTQNDPSVTPDSLLPPEASTLEKVTQGLSETDLLSVAEMVALVEQRTAMALQGMVAQAQPATGYIHPQHTVLQGTVSDPSPIVFLSESPVPPQPPPSQATLDEQQQELRHVAQAESQQQHLENLRPGSGLGLDLSGREFCGGDSGGGGPTHGRGEVRIAFWVSSLDPHSQSEPAGRPRCMFMSCGGGGSQTEASAKEKITCDLYQLVSPSSQDPSQLAGSPKADPHHGEGHLDRPASTPDPSQDLSSGEKKTVGRERVTGFHVEVVVTSAVDQCVFYAKDGTENVQEETVCFAMHSGASPADTSEDPRPGQLFFLQPSRSEEDSSSSSSGMFSLDCANNNGPAGGSTERPDSPRVGVEDCSDPSSCRLVSHDFLEIRFQIQRLLEPRQYMLLLPDHIMINIFKYLPTRSLAALKCTCHDFKALIELYGVRATDSRWNQDPLYRDDPCKQCKRQYKWGDVSLCRWHPKPYHHDLPYGRSYWMCCRCTDKDTPGCRVGLHDNNWVQLCQLVQTLAGGREVEGASLLAH